MILPVRRVESARMLRGKDREKDKKRHADGNGRRVFHDRRKGGRVQQLQKNGGPRIQVGKLGEKRKADLPVPHADDCVRDKEKDEDLQDSHSHAPDSG